MDALLHDRILWLLVLMVATLLGMAVLFTGFTVLLRLKNEREDRLWDRLEETWEPLLLGVLAKQLCNPNADEHHRDQNRN